MDAKRKISAVVFSDLGQAAAFMKLDWVQRALEKSLGFAPFPATLNVRPTTAEDLKVWQSLCRDEKGIPLLPSEGGFCAARLFPVALHELRSERNGSTKGAVLLPEVANYPKDKIEIVAAVRLKDDFGVRDGDQLTLEFVP
jgi:CTP-dependent riboflavin kinase